MFENPTSEAAENPKGTVQVTRTVPQSVDDVWKLLVQPATTELLLGEGAVLGEKGDQWQAADGTYGVLRSYHPKEQIRFSWHAGEQAPATMVELDLAKVDEGTQLVVTQTKLDADADAGALEQKWSQALDRVVEQLG